jgi:hypothetical protein
MTIFLFGAFYFLVKEFEEASKDNTLPRTWGKWWNNDTGWVNKHRWGYVVADWLGFGSAFFYHLFRTALVFLTDAPHAFQLLKFIVLSFMVASLSTPIIGALFIGGIYLGGLIKELMKFAGLKWII